MWECPCTDCMCPIPLVEELDLIWMQVMSFLRVCWQLSPGRGEARDRGARAGAGCEARLPLWSVTNTALMGMGVWYQVAEAEALMVSTELALFYLSVCFPLSRNWDACPRSGERWSKWGSCRLLDHVSWRQKSELPPTCCCLSKRPRLFSSLYSDAASRASPLCPSQPISAPGLHGLSPVVGPHHKAGGPTRTLGMCWEVSCGGEATIRDLGCFWCAAWLSANNGCLCQPSLHTGAG